MSRRYCLLNQQTLDDSIGTAPAYNTRQRDRIYLPERRTFTDAYKLVSNPALTSKTKEIIFQILNRTIWTKNKAHKSRRRLDPNCDRCGNPETMEHLLNECSHYSEPLWDRLGELLTKFLNSISEDYIPRVELGFRQVIFNMPHPSILLHVKDKNTRMLLIMLIQEIKRDIIYTVPAEIRCRSLKLVNLKIGSKIFILVFYKEATCIHIYYIINMFSVVGYIFTPLKTPPEAS